MYLTPTRTNRSSRRYEQEAISTSSRRVYEARSLSRLSSRLILEEFFLRLSLGAYSSSSRVLSEACTSLYESFIEISNRRTSSFASLLLPLPLRPTLLQQSYSNYSTLVSPHTSQLANRNSRLVVVPPLITHLNCGKD